METTPATGRCIIVSAPSGSGKSTIVRYLMEQHPELRLHFSISATSRPPRGTERDGVDYHFLSIEDFRRRIDDGDFLEYEEVYPGRYYGTLRSEVDQRLASGENLVFDVDVKGGCRLKQAFGERALSLFIQPPSVEELGRRLRARATDPEDQIAQRLAKAEEELAYASRFDRTIVNDDLQRAQAEAVALLTDFLL